MRGANIGSSGGKNLKAIAQPKIGNVTGYAFAALAGLLVMLWAAFYVRLIPPLVREWYEHENFSYAFLIPLISTYLAFEERERLKKIEIAPDFRGAILLGVALAIGLVGNMLGEPFISRVSLIGALAAIIWTTTGWKFVRVLGFALAYLLLMVPPPYVIVKEVSYYLRMLDAIVSAGALQAINVPVYRDSYFLVLPDITLEVADVCSGVASLFAMISLGAIYVYYLPTRGVGKFLMLVATLVFPLIANLMRIILVGITVYWWGPVMLGAFYHHFTGTFTFSLGVVMLLVSGEFLRRRYPARDAKGAAKSYPESEDENRHHNVGLAPMVIAGVLLIFALYGSRSMVFFPSIALHHDLADLPRQIGRFHATPELWEGPYTDPQAEAVLSRLYEAPEQGRVELFVGYLGAQSAEHRLRSPQLVFPDGWEYAAMSKLQFRYDKENIDAAWLLTKKSSAKRLVLFWYQLPGKTYSSDVWYRLALARRLIFESRTDGAVIRLATDFKDSETVDQALKRLIDFSLHVFPEVRRLLPEA